MNLPASCLLRIYLNMPAQFFDVRLAFDSTLFLRFAARRAPTIRHIALPGTRFYRLHSLELSALSYRLCCTSPVTMISCINVRHVSHHRPLKMSDIVCRLEIQAVRGFDKPTELLPGELVKASRSQILCRWSVHPIGLTYLATFASNRTSKRVRPKLNITDAQIFLVNVAGWRYE